MKTNILLFLFITTLLACNTQPEQKPAIDIQGHRGARGLYPENTIEGFLRAIDMGVTTLEMDVVVSGDSQLVVSHDPYINPEFCDCGTIKDTINIFKIPYDSVKQFDCGSKPHPRFPKQKKMVAYKPLLSDVIDTVEAYIKAKGLKPINYNIETKCEAKGDSIYNPAPKYFGEALYKMIVAKKIANRVTAQSFDTRTLDYMYMYGQEIPEKIKFALLVENATNFDSELARLTFTPTIYSPDFKLINKDVVDKLHAKGMKVIPWTVNDDRDIRRVAEMGVDGIISDYPDKVVKLLAKP
jgi:glycerophosphoryl diester phosphodiesterase